MRNCPGPERGVFYILIIDIILRSGLVVFSLLSAKITTTTRGMIVPYIRNSVDIDKVSYQYCSYLYSREIYQCKYIFCYCPLNYDDYDICIMFHFKLWSNFDCITNIGSIHFWYIWTQHFCSKQINSVYSIFDPQKQAQLSGSCHETKTPMKDRALFRVEW